MRSIAIALLAAAALPAGAQQHAHPAGRSGAPARAVAAAARDARVVEVEASDFKFRIADTVEAGLVTFRLTNRGPDLHHVALLRLEDGKTVADLLAAMKRGGKPPEWVTEVGGPNAVVGDDASLATLPLEPGRYVVVCFIHGSDGVPHVAKGMRKEIVVVPARGRPARPARAAAPSAELVLRDYEFDLSKPLVAGKQVVRVRNVAAQAHEVAIIQLAPGKTAQDMLAWVQKQDGPPPGRPVGGTTGLSRSEWNDIALDLQPGEYALICFYPDEAGKPHFAHGMVREIKVTAK